MEGRWRRQCREPVSVWTTPATIKKAKPAKTDIKEPDTYLLEGSHILGRDGHQIEGQCAECGEVGHLKAECPHAFQHKYGQPIPGCRTAHGGESTEQCGWQTIMVRGGRVGQGAQGVGEARVGAAGQNVRGSAHRVAAACALLGGVETDLQLPMTRHDRPGLAPRCRGPLEGRTSATDTAPESARAARATNRPPDHNNGGKAPGRPEATTKSLGVG